MAILELCISGQDEKLAELIKILEDGGDRANARLLHKIREKSLHNELTVTCCGYVSSGKSLLINKLTGQKDLLPVSPLPTGGGAVWLRGGRDGDLCYKHHLNESGQDESIESVELASPMFQGLGFIDTPGIDSVESSLLLAQNPALLMSDLVLYVTDYNHVQSQVNFTFLKNLQSRGIPYLLLVNQIDKHVSLEISLAEFRTRLQHALAQWGLKPVQLFFTSLLGDKLPECQFEQLKETLSGLPMAGPDLLHSGAARSVRGILERHGKFVLQQQTKQRQPHIWVTEQQLSEQAARENYEVLAKKIARLTNIKETIAQETMSEINQLLENAPLFSYAARELARDYLVSQQPGFKAGFFAGAARTKAEKEQRRHRFHQELLTRAEANITWHMRKLLAAIPSRYDLPDEKFAAEAAQLSVNLAPELLQLTIANGALLTDDYVMNYTRDLANAIKSVFRQSSWDWIERAQASASRKIEPELVALNEKKSSLSRLLESYDSLKKLDDQHKSYLSGLLEPWEDLARASTFKLKQEQKHSGTPAGKISSKRHERRNFPGPIQQKANSASRNVHPKVWAAARKLQECADLAEPLPGFALRVKALRQRSTRLEHNLFTVALFGAFSAGKSSLANALLGDNILPVSPNPTTAAINKILPPTKQYPHGTVKVKLKSQDDLAADVMASLAVLGCKADDLAGGLMLIETLDIREIPLEGKPHLSFLSAVARGQKDFMEKLGQETIVGYAEFYDFVVQEDRACFVEWIEVYYSCPLTEKGIVLVDTPGSNSINARHTNVAFDYIKNSDAVLFLTYYNNPFCKADAQFLAQLGKVKDSFDLDKMFFLINAADLASTAEELGLVLKHVEENLRSNQIIRPRLFPVSSQLALLAKLDRAGRLQTETEELYRQRLKLPAGAVLPAPEAGLAISGLQQFESAFYSFIEVELVSLAVGAASQEILQIQRHVQELLQIAKTAASERHAKVKHYNNLQQKIVDDSERITFLAEKHAIKQEIEELFYYVKQRFAHHFANMFDAGFYRLGLVNEEPTKLIVEQCAKELLQEVEVELEQEIRATSLRVERFVHKTLKEVLDKQSAVVMQHDPQYSGSWERQNLLDDEGIIPAFVWNQDALKRLNSIYKNPRDWTEGQGRAKMRDALQKILQPQAYHWLDGVADSFKKRWLQAFQSATLNLKAQIQGEIADYYNGVKAALGAGYDMEYLEHSHEQFESLLSF